MWQLAWLAAGKFTAEGLRHQSQKGLPRVNSLLLLLPPLTLSPPLPFPWLFTASDKYKDRTYLVNMQKVDGDDVGLDFDSLDPNFLLVSRQVDFGEGLKGFGVSTCRDWGIGVMASD